MKIQFVCVAPAPYSKNDNDFTECLVVVYKRWDYLNRIQLIIYGLHYYVKYLQVI